LYSKTVLRVKYIMSMYHEREANINIINNMNILYSVKILKKDNAIIGVFKQVWEISGFGSNNVCRGCFI